VFHIHIGAHKVGSTSLQRFFALNAGLLEDLGVVYPPVGFGTFAHHPLAKAFTESKHVHEREALKADLARLAAEGPDKTFLLSSEVFEFARPAGIQELAEAVAPHETQILFYVRDFTKMIPSKYAQRTKTGGNHKNFDDFLNIAHEMRWLSFTRIVTNWAEQFGWDAMRVQVLDRETLVHGDLLRDAWAALGLPADAFDQCDPASLEPVNTSPNWVALEAVREVNRRLSKADLGLPSDQKTKGLRRTKAMEEARFAVDGLRVGKLLDVCEQATTEAGLAERPGQYLSLEQWTTLNDLFRKEIRRLNGRLPGSPVMVPSSRPPPERPFLPQFSELSDEERARMGRRVLTARAVKRLPPTVIDTIASAFGIKAKPVGSRRTASWPDAARAAVTRLLGSTSGKASRVSHKKELAAARAAHAARRRGAQGAAGAGESAPAVGASAKAGKGARRIEARPTLIRRIQRRIARWSRRLRGERRQPKTTS
jgi:hypothetical protein